MISLINGTDELAFLPSDAYSARITAQCKTYGTGYSFASFWVQTVDGVSVAAISRVDGDMTLCSTGNADFEEIAAFIGAVGYSSITYDASCSEKLGLSPQKSSFTVRYKGGAKKCEDGVLFDYDKKDLFNLLKECGFDLGSYDAFLADICARLNKSAATVAAAENDGKLCACAFALFEGDKSVLLGAVGTKPEARGKGYASKLVGTLAEMKKEKDVFLFCRNDSLADFYSGIGFEIVGKWAVETR